MAALWYYCGELSYCLRCESVLKPDQAAVAGSVVAVQAVLNRETRDALSPAEKSYLNESFQYTGGALAVTALVARSMFKNGFAFRVMSANPCKCRWDVELVL